MKTKTAMETLKMVITTPMNRIMLRCAVFALLLLTFTTSFSQQETLNLLQNNPVLLDQYNGLYYINQSNNSRSTFFYEEESFVVETDTISLPFIDDFSKNLARSFNAEIENIYDTVLATGKCLDDNEVPTATVDYDTVQSYFYVYDTTLMMVVDSIPKDPITLFVFDSNAVSSCFSNIIDTLTLWPSHFNFTDTCGADSCYSRDITLPTGALYFTLSEPGLIIDRDSFLYEGAGTCIESQEDTFVLVPAIVAPSVSWEYFFNATTKAADSIPDTTNFTVVTIHTGIDPCKCLDFVNNTDTLRPLFWRFTYDTFGNKIDSSLSQPETNYRISRIFHKTNNKLWMDNHAYINNTFPIDPPSYGVATLDGLDRFGRPYNLSSGDSYGDADVLTSKPIKMGCYEESDGIFLSFYFQPRGLGDFPDREDSLVLEFRDKLKSEWIPVWGRGGYLLSGEVPDTFERVYVQLEDQTLSSDPIWFYDGFQFRFRNKATLAGNNDHWHIDYVRLETAVTDSSPIVDVGISSVIPNWLKEYEQMPWNQFFADTINSLIDTALFKFHNPAFPQTGPDTDYEFSITDVQTSTVFGTDANNFTWFLNDVFRGFSPDARFSFVSPPNTDYVEWNSRVIVTPTSDNLNKSNDTLERKQIFSNLLAYDDGTAERSYGLEGPGIKKFAYRFILNEPDYLGGIQMHFSNVNANVSNLIFNILVWDEIELNNPAPEDSVIRELFNRKAVYIDSSNGFYNLNLSIDTPIYVEDTFYIGWAQTDTRNLQIGYDLNSNKGFDHMFVNIGGQWKKSSVDVQGSPMIRAVLDSFYTEWTTSIPEEPAPQISVEGFDFGLYPNPATQQIFINTNDDQSNYTYLIYNTLGEMLAYDNLTANPIDIQTFTSGIYFIQVQDKQSGAKATKKFIKQ